MYVNVRFWVTYLQKTKPTAGLLWLNDYFLKQSYVRGIILINEHKYVDKQINNDQSMFVAYKYFYLLFNPSCRGFFSHSASSHISKFLYLLGQNNILECSNNIRCIIMTNLWLLLFITSLQL